MFRLAEAVWWPWAKLIGIAIVMMLLVFVAWWALFADRSRGRRRCPRCWYDLTYSPGLRCGECGFTARREAELHRARRRHGIALLALIGAALFGGYVIDGVRSEGWASYLPTRGLIWMMPLVNDRDPQVYNELIVRMRAGDLTEGQWLSLLKRCAAGEPGARPPGDAWKDSWYNEFAAVSARFLLVRAQSERRRRRAGEILLDLARRGEPVVEITGRAAWPAGVAPVLDVEARDWMERDLTQMRIVARPRLDGAAPRVHQLRRGAIQSRSYSLHLPALPPGEHQVEIDVEVERRALDGDAWVPAGRRSITVPLRVAPDDAPALEPVTNEDVDALVRAAFLPGLVQWETGSLPVRISVDARQTYREILNDTAVAVRIDVLRDGELGRQLDIWWHAGRGVADRQYAWEVPMLNEMVLAPPAREDEQWSLRVRGLPELAYRVEGVTRYWSGDVTIPVVVSSRRGSAPSRGWIPADEEKVDP